MSLVILLGTLTLYCSLFFLFAIRASKPRTAKVKFWFLLVVRLGAPFLVPLLITVGILLVFGNRTAYHLGVGIVILFPFFMSILMSILGFLVASVTVAYLRVRGTAMYMPLLVTVVMGGAGGCAGCLMATLLIPLH